jgi:hypothetical protein
MTDVEIPPVAEVELKRVARVSKRSELVDVRLASCFVKAQDNPQELSAEWGDRALAGFDLSVSSPPDGEGAFTVRVEFLTLHFSSWDARTGDEVPPLDDEEPTVHLECDFLCSYRALEGADFDVGDVAHFARVNAPLHVWPYWREIAHSMSLRLGVPALHVGLLSIPSVFDPEA